MQVCVCACVCVCSEVTADATVALQPILSITVRTARWTEIHTQTHTHTQTHRVGTCTQKTQGKGKIKAWLGVNTPTYSSFYCWASCKLRSERRPEGIWVQNTSNVQGLDLLALLTHLKCRQGHLKTQIFMAAGQKYCCKTYASTHCIVMARCRYGAVGQ